MTARRRVWDPVVRVLHWALVVAFALGWATIFWWSRWHEAIGYAALAVVVVRSAWGFAGPRHARFAQFVRTPRETLRYARLALSRNEPRYVGHNPLGACMVLALIGCVIVLAATGWLYRSDWFWGDEAVERIHIASAWTMLALVVVHVAGVAWSSLRHRENLVVAMLDGTKRQAEGGDIA